MMDGLWKGIALGCFLLTFSVFMGCVVRVGDWDILGVGENFRRRGMGETPKMRTDNFFFNAYTFNKAHANRLVPFKTATDSSG